MTTLDQYTRTLADRRAAAAQRREYAQAGMRDLLDQAALRGGSG